MQKQLTPHLRQILSVAVPANATKDKEQHPIMILIVISVHEHSQ